ncbi:MAG: tetratricopeptide repeat protein [Spirochaetaceae bacterium]
MGLIILIILLGMAIGVTTFFLIKSILAPKRVGKLESLVKQKKSSAAVRVGKQIVAREPRNGDAHYFLGLAYLQDNKPELALMELKTVNQIGNFNGRIPELPFREKIADLFAKFNQPEEALKEYLLLIQKDKGNPNYYYKAGKLFEKRDKPKRAVAYYKKALAYDPSHDEAYMRMGTLLYRAKRPAEAKGYLEKAVAFQPDNYEAHFYLGRIAKENKDFRGAISAFEKSVKSQEFKARSLMERGVCYIKLNDMGRAISELERAVKQSEEDASAGETLYSRYYLATAYEQTRKIEPAIEQWEQIYKQRPNFQNVAEKLSQYQDLREDDRVKDFLTMGQDEFRETCSAITQSMGLRVQDINDIDQGCEVLAYEAQSKWRNARQMPKLIWFVRIPDLIDESRVRSLHEAMKNQNITRGILVSSSNFSRVAMDFAETRPIDLFNKERLQEMLKRTA